MAETLHLSLLGGVQIARGGQPVTGFVSTKAQALLCYLAVTGRPHLRPALAGLLWGEMPEANAKTNLRQALTNLHHIVAPHLRITRQAVAFDRDSPYWLDVECFEAKAGGASTKPDLEQLREAVELYRGDFLEGFYVRQAPAFEEWALAQRARLRELAMQAMHWMAVRCAGQGEAGLAAGIDYTTRLLALEPWREDAHRQLMLLLAHSGQRGAALAQYEMCCRVLAEELGVAPGPETVALAEAIKSGLIGPEAMQVRTTASQVRGIPKTGARERFLTSLVGRAAEMDTLREVWRRVVETTGQVVLVEGEPGIGKTRLIGELLTEVSDHALVLRAKCPELREPLAYTLFADPLREALAGDAPPGLTDTWLAELSRLLPELRDRHPNLPQPAQLDPADERRRLFDAVCITLLSLAERRPLVLFLDDLQWADLTSLELLHHLIDRISQASVLIIGTYRPHEMGPGHPLQTKRRAWQRTGLLTGLPLPPLSEPAVNDLIRELTTWSGDDPAFGALIYRETAGNPLFVVETVASLRDEGRLPQKAEDWSCGFQAESLTIPPRVQVIIEARLNRLDDLSHQLITATAVIRSSFPAEVAQAVSGWSDLETLDSLERLLASGLLVEAGENSFTFSHDKIREVAYQALSQPRRRLFHRRMAETLERRHRGREQTVAEPLAYHFKRAGDQDKALDYYLRAAQMARQQYAYEVAISHYQEALACLQGLGDYGRAARTLMQLGLTYHNIFEFERARQAYQEGFALWQRAGDMWPAVPLRPAPHALRMAWEDPVTLDSAMALDIPSHAVIQQLFSGLVELSPELDVLPDVAYSWEILEDGRRYIFHLRNDVQWSDGTPMTAEDFEYAWKRVLDPVTNSPNASLLYDVKGARAFHQKEGRWEDVGVGALNDTLVVELEEPIGYFLHLLTHTATYPIPRHVVEALDQAWTQVGKIVTNGPFRLESRDRNQSMIFSRKPDYHGRFRGNLQCVELYFTGENPSAKLKMYETGDLDIFDLAVLPPLEMDQARYGHAEEYMPYPVLNTSYVGFNVSQQPFIDRRVRRAFAMAIDRKTLVDVILKGYQIPATGGLIPPAMPGYSAGNSLPNDRDRSGQLLAEAGFEGGRGFPEIDLLALPESLPVCQYLQAQWQANLGVKVGYQIAERGLFFDRLNREPPPMHIWGWVADYPDPDNFLRAGYFRHNTRWRNEAYDRLMEDARRVMDRGKRMQLYAHADRILVEEAPIVPLAHEARHLLVKPWVGKFPTSATRRWFWKDVIIGPH